MAAVKPTVRAGSSLASSATAALPRLNPLTKFPLNLGNPGSASLHSPAFPQASAAHGMPKTARSVIGPVSLPKVSMQLTPHSWMPTPFLNKAPTAVPLASMTGGLRR